MKNIFKKLLILILLMPYMATANEVSDQYGNNYLLETDYAYILNLPINHTNILVAVLGSGINYNNVYLQDSIFTNPNEIADNGIDDDGNGKVDDIRGWDWTNDGDNDPISEESDHETGVAGIIGAKFNPYKNHSGLFPSVKILNLRRSYEQFKIADSIRYATDIAEANNMRVVISCSFGQTSESSEYIEAINYGISKRAIIVSSSGNEGNTEPRYPASNTNVISVSGLIRDNITVGSSYSYGDTVNYSAQASFKDILSETNQYKETSGTSFSTPIVSAIIARLLAYDNTLTKTQIMTLLDNNSTVLPNGYGRRINVKQLIESFGITFETKKIKYSGTRNNVVVEIEIARKDGAVIRKVLKYIYINNDRAISIHKELPL